MAGLRVAVEGEVQEHVVPRTDGRKRHEGGTSAILGWSGRVR